jgi:lipoate-protein ligase A
MSWRFLNYHIYEGAWNMALDEAILHHVEKGGRPLFRLYGWKPWCLTLGHFQKPDEEVDRQAAAEAGIDVVRRYTGGRAVFHAQELTYSVICPVGKDEEWKSGGQVYEQVSEILAQSLRDLGVEAFLQKADTPLPSHGDVAPPCFSSTAKSEVEVGRRKLIGSAQRRGKGVILQHGSILIGKAHLDIVNYLHLKPEERARHLNILAEHSICLEELDLEITPEELAASVQKVFCKQYPETDIMDLPGMDELKEAEQLLPFYRMEK